MQSILLDADNGFGPGTADAEVGTGAELGPLGLVELLLKDPARLDQRCQEERHQPELLSRLLAVAQAGYLLFGLVMVLLLAVAPAGLPELVVPLPPASVGDGTALALPLAYNLGVVLAACICLPSFYFYSLLAGVRLSWLQIALIVVKGNAANAVLLLGVLPMYVAVVLGLVVFEAPADAVQAALGFGLVLPFLAGLWGLRAIYRGILAATAVLPAEWQGRRRCFLRRLTLSWAGVYTAVVPVLIYRLWETFATWLGVG